MAPDILPTPKGRAPLPLPGSGPVTVTILEVRPGVFRLRIEEERDADGKRNFRYQTTHGTRDDAELLRLQILRDHRAGEGPTRQRQPKGAAALALGDYLKRWVDLRQRRGEISESTGGWYGTILNYVIPKLGTRPLREVTSAEIQEIYDDLLQRLSPRTVRHVHSRLVSAFDDALVEGLIATNPMANRKVRPPKAEETKVSTLSQDEVSTLVTCCAKNHPAIAPLVRFAVSTGLRRGEICALTWADVDIEDGIATAVNVRSNAVQVGNNVTVKRPKTKSSIRRVALPPSMGHELIELRAAAEVRGGGAELNKRFVFPAGHGGMRAPGALTHQVNRALADCGLGHFTLHDLRHAHATFLLSKRMPVKAVSQRLGHADIAITLRTYAHVIPQDDEALALLSEGLLPTRRGPSPLDPSEDDDED